VVTEINTESGPRPYAVANGDKHYGSAIIVTASVGVMTTGSIDFLSPLSDSRIGEYKKLNMTGAGGKVSLKWDSVF
jgi:hypothetical protein